MEDIVIKTLAEGGVLEKPIKSITMLGSGQRIVWMQKSDGLHIQLPRKLPNSLAIGFKIDL